MPDSERTTALVRAAQTGDERAFAELVGSYQDIAVAYATSIIGDYHLAEDAAQEAFVDAHRALPSLREPAAFAAWFRTIVFKHCDRMTRRKRPPLAGLDAALHVESREPSPHVALERHETRQALREAIATLSDVEQQVVLLYYMGEHSHATIAAFLDVTANAVKTRLYSARRRLRKHMAEVEQDLNAARPSGGPAFVEKVQRMIRPEALKKNEPLFWTPAIGADLWEMFCAAITGDVEAITALLDKDPSLARGHYEYRTPLSFAVRENQIEVAALLLARGADPINSGMPDTLLQVARDRGYVEMERLLQTALGAQGAAPRGEGIAAAIRERDAVRVRALLDASPELLHAGDERTNQPIHWATMTRQLDVIDDLLDRGADINARRQDGARPIQLTNGDYMYRGWRDVPKDVGTTPDDVYRHLVGRGAYVDIGMAAVKGNLDRVRELLDLDPSLANRVADYGSYYLGCGAPIKNAAAGGHIEIVRLLLDRGADPNLPEEGIAPRGHALYSAVYNGHYEVARLLLDSGAYPNVEVESSADTLSIALMRGDRKMIDLLCAYGAARAVHLLAHHGDVQTAAAVFAANPALADDPDALANAAGQGHESFVRLMLRYQPDLPRRLTFSAWAGAPTRELNELLFQHGMDPNQPNWLRITSLHQMAEAGDVDKASVFIEHGADLHARDEELRSTPLGYAAKYGKTLLVEFLLRRGAKPSLPDDPPWATPMAWAIRRGHDEIVRLLERFEADGSLPPLRSLAHFESLANDFVEAYGSEDDTAALRRIAAHFQVRRLSNAGQLRSHVRARLGLRPTVDDGPRTLSLADAQSLVARGHGFDRWSQLGNAVENH